MLKRQSIDGDTRGRGVSYLSTGQVLPERGPIGAPDLTEILYQFQ